MAQRATVRDFNIRGVGLTVTHPIEPGTEVTVEPEDGPLTPPLRADVRHASTLADGEIVIGCQFARLLKTADVLALG